MSTGLFTPGFSNAARYVDESTRRGRRHLHQSNVFGIGSDLLEELATVWEACRKPNWDGFEALAVSQETLRQAYLFLEALPLGFPAPSIGAEPDGDLTFEWHHFRRRTLSVSVGAEGNLHFAGLFGPNRTFGTEAFFGDIPEGVLALIGRVYGT